MDIRVSSFIVVIMSLRWSWRVEFFHDVQANWNENEFVPFSFEFLDIWISSFLSGGLSGEAPAKGAAESIVKTNLSIYQILLNKLEFPFIFISTDYYLLNIYYY